MPIHVTTDHFETEVLKSDVPVLVDFYADWCGPCKMLAPLVEQFAQENPQVKVCKINVDDQADLAMDYDVRSIPTLVVFKDGKEANRSVGLISKSQLQNLI